MTCRRHHPRGFTFVELMMGMIVTGLVLSALAVFVFSVADGWSGSETVQSIYLSGNMGVDRIDRAIRAASMVDPNTTHGTLDNSGSPAACMFWHDDGDGDAALAGFSGDGQIEFCEMSLLIYSPSTQTINLYSMPTPTTAAQIAQASLPESQLMTPAAFIASGYVTATPLAHNVTACEFFPVTATSTERSSLEVIMVVGDSQAKTTIYTTATLRCPNGSQ
jgi:prepilin-type N-terminal cleavage/methylation domain-containing protein